MAPATRRARGFGGRAPILTFFSFMDYFRCSCRKLVHRSPTDCYRRSRSPTDCYRRSRSPMDYFRCSCRKLVQWSPFFSASFQLPPVLVPAGSGSFLPGACSCRLRSLLFIRNPITTDRPDISQWNDEGGRIPDDGSSDRLMRRMIPPPKAFPRRDGGRASGQRGSVRSALRTGPSAASPGRTRWREATGLLSLPLPLLD